MLLKENNVWGNCLEYWQLRSQWRSDRVFISAATLFFLMTFFLNFVFLFSLFMPHWLVDFF